MAAVGTEQGFKQDVALARAAARGDRAAQREIAERLLDRVRTTVTYLAPNHPDLNDLAQRSLLEILRSVGTFSGGSSLETWADRVASRTAMRLIKQKSRQAEVVTLVADPEPPDWLPQEDEESRQRLRRRLTALLSRISPDRREVLVLHLVHGYTVAEIAEMTDTPANTVRDRLQVGRAQLRNHILHDPVLGRSRLAGTD